MISYVIVILSQKPSEVKMETRWEMLTPPDFRKLAQEHKVCVLPIGSLERHGEHLPFGTDGMACHAKAVAASKIEPCVVFPPYWFGQVHEAACFSGTINFSTTMCLQILETLLDQIAQNGFEKIVILSGHGGNGNMLNYFAMSQMDRKVNYTLYITDTNGSHSQALKDMWETGGGHACERETSMMMHVTPEAVKMEYQRFPEPLAIRADLSHLKGVHTALWWYSIAPEQVVGCPSKATPEKGKRAFDAAVLDFSERLKAIKADTVVPELQKEFYARLDKVGES